MLIRAPVEGCRDPSQRVAALAQMTDFCEHALLAGVGFDVLAVRAETESEPDIPTRSPLVRLCRSAFPRAFPDGFPLPLAHRRHDGDD